MFVFSAVEHRYLISSRIPFHSLSIGDLLQSSCDAVLLPLSTRGFNLKLPAVFRTIKGSYSKNSANCVTICYRKRSKNSLNHVINWRNCAEMNKFPCEQKSEIGKLFCILKCKVGPQCVSIVSLPM